MSINSPEQFERLRACGMIVGKALRWLRKCAPAKDGWTYRTVDGSLSAHYEHTMVITRGEPVLLTAA